MANELTERLRAHADAHEYLARLDGWQKQLMDDLREAATAIERLQAENVSFRAAMKACEDCGPNDPVWIEGEPWNLEAAAADALEWLRSFCARPNGLPLGSLNRERLAAAADALEGFMSQRDEDRCGGCDGLA